MFDGEEEANYIKEIIYASNAVIIFVDAVQLALTDDLGLCKRITGADKLCMLLKDYERSYKNSDTIILFALSKCDSDLIPQKYKENEYIELVQKCSLIYKDILKIKGKCNRWHFGIAPVSSVGRGRTRSNKTDTNILLRPYLVSCELIKLPLPENVAESFLFCIKEAVNISLSYLHNESQCIQRQVEDAFSQATLLNSIWSAIRKKESYIEIAKKLNESKSISEKTAKKLNAILNMLQQDGFMEKVYSL